MWCWKAVSPSEPMPQTIYWFWLVGSIGRSHDPLSTVTKVMFSDLYSDMIIFQAGLHGLKGLVKEMHCCPSWTKPDTSETSLVQVLPVVVSTVSGHAPRPPRHYTYIKISIIHTCAYAVIFHYSIFINKVCIPAHSHLDSSLEPVLFHPCPPRLW